MPSSDRLNRRTFIRAGGAACLMTAAGKSMASAHPRLLSNAVAESRGDSTIFKSLKIGMVQVEGDLTAKFRAAAEAGFEGIELNSPSFDIAEARKAITETGLPVDGTVCSTHWRITHTHPDAKVRTQALKDLQTAIRETHAVGGNTVLLVAGVGGDGEHEEIWQRAIENISKALPLAARLGITIAIENVWNRFMYDHDGDENQTAEAYAKFVDELNSPWIGMQFDIGNHWKYGDCGSWIRTLGKRIVKLDVKGYSRASQNWAKLGEDDINWADVRAALNEIGFHGWAAAEVGGGGPDRLKEISDAMDVCLGLT